MRLVSSPTFRVVPSLRRSAVNPSRLIRLDLSDGTRGPDVSNRIAVRSVLCMFFSTTANPTCQPPMTGEYFQFLITHECQMVFFFLLPFLPRLHLYEALRLLVYVWVYRYLTSPTRISSTGGKYNCHSLLDHLYPSPVR